MNSRSKFHVEEVLHSSPSILYKFIATPSGLSRWFADKVEEEDGVYTFFWNDISEKAQLLDKKENEFIRYRWLDNENEEEFFEFQIRKDNITKDTALIINDFADENEVDDQKRLWESQLSDLKRNIGSS